MRCEFYYTKATHGSFPWHAYTVVVELVGGREQRIRIETGSCSFKWGARRELKRHVRQHIKSGLRTAHYTEVVDVYD